MPSLVETTAEQPAQKMPRATKLLKQAVVLSMILLIFNDLLGGIIKYYSASAALLYISYVPMLCAGLVVIAYFVYYGLAMRLHRGMATFIILFLLSTIYGLFSGRGINAVAFGLYIWLPFFLGMLVTTLDVDSNFKKYTLLWWAIATAGILINSQVTFPWIGESYQAFGQTLQAARSWSAAGFDRLAGFSRASYVASNQIALFCMVMLAARGSLLKKIVIWALSTTAVYLTTSKITLLIMILAPLLMIAVAFSQNKKSTSPAADKKTRRVALIILLVLTALMVLLPILTLTNRSSVGSSSAIGFLTLSSIYERMYMMWPTAWDLIFKDDNPILMIFGRGIGGIGTPQVFFEALKQNSGDNLFIYLYVSFGVGSLLFVRHLVTGIKNWLPVNSSAFLIYFALTSVLVTIGITSNVVENATTLLILGMLIGKATQTRPKAPAPILSEIKK